MKAVRFTVPKFKFRKLLFVGSAGQPGAVAYGFEDDDAADYFVARKVAVLTDDTPDVVFSRDEIDLDPDTVWAPGTPASIGIAGQKVLPPASGAASNGGDA